MFETMGWKLETGVEGNHCFFLHVDIILILNGALLRIGFLGKRQLVIQQEY